ncbi:hypothetical protein ACWDKQ_11200 [Saccharopolyspora sp. NPDC000995]
MLLFCLVTGHHYLVVDHGERTRREVLARAAEFLLERRVAHE